LWNLKLDRTFNKREVRVLMALGLTVFALCVVSLYLDYILMTQHTGFYIAPVVGGNILFIGLVSYALFTEILAVLLMWKMFKKMEMPRLAKVALAQSVTLTLDAFFLGFVPPPCPFICC